jgi:hypothetical protein
MLRKLEDSKALETASSDDGSDKIYYRPGSRSALLVKAPDESAVHVFQQPDECDLERFHARIFALFRHFNKRITQKLVRTGVPDKQIQTMTMMAQPVDSALKVSFHTIGGDDIYDNIFESDSIIENVVHYVMERNYSSGQSKKVIVYENDSVVALSKPIKHFIEDMLTVSVYEDGEEPFYARLGDDPDNLPSVLVMRESGEHTKIRRNLEVLEAYPEILEDLEADAPGKPRPALKDYVGWSQKYTHQLKQLSRTVFVEELGMETKVVKKLERRTIKEIRRARKRSSGYEKRKFAGGSWEHKTKKKSKRATNDLHEKKKKKKPKLATIDSHEILGGG